MPIVLQSCEVKKVEWYTSHRCEAIDSGHNKVMIKPILVAKSDRKTVHGCCVALACIMFPIRFQCMFKFYIVPS